MTRYQSGLARVQNSKVTHSLALSVELANELGPVLEANFEDFALLDLRDLDEVEVGVEEELLVLLVLDELEVLPEEIGKEESEVEDQLLVLVLRLGVCAGDIWGHAAMNDQRR